MQQEPFITVNWQEGEAELHVGKIYKKAYPLLKVDVMEDIASMAEQELEKAYEELYPGRAMQRQLHENARRSHWAAELTGKTIKSAEALRNGHLALEIDDGRVVVVGAGGSVDVFAFSSLKDLHANVKPDDKRYMTQPCETERAKAIARTI